MAVFNAPAWMMKGGAAKGSVESLESSDSSPFENRTRVDFSLEDFKFVRSTWTISYKIKKSGFSNKFGRVWIEVNRDKDGNEINWKYYDLGITVNLTDVGASKSYSFSKEISRSPDAKQAISYTSNNNIFFLFLTDNEICRDQIHPTVEGSSTPIPKK